jgi:hypothetical protein
VQRSAPVHVIAWDASGEASHTAFPANGGTVEGWEFQVVNTSGGTRQVMGTVICAKPAS